MKIIKNTFVILIFAYSSNIYALCIYPDEMFEAAYPDPTYKIVSCTHSKNIIDPYIPRNPKGTYDKVDYLPTDLAIEVAADNDDAKKHMGGRESLFWYYQGDCSEITLGKLLNKPSIDRICCDDGPVKTAYCALGTELLEI